MKRVHERVTSSWVLDEYEKETTVVINGLTKEVNALTPVST